MTSLLITSKTAVKGFSGGTKPTVEKSVTLPSQNTWVELATIGDFADEIPNLANFAISGRFKVDSSTGIFEFQLRESDGVAVVATLDGTIQPNTNYANYTIRGKNESGSQFPTGMRLFARYTNAVPNMNLLLEEESLYVHYAEFNNITDMLGIVYQVDSIFIWGSTELLNGIAGITVPSQDFVEIPVNGLMSKFIFSANSGNLMYSWSGSTIGISP